MAKKHSVAVEKAKRQGVKKYFYITGPTGWDLSGLLPKMDMVARLIIDLYAEQRVSQEYYDDHRDIFYSYIEGIDDWVSEASETLLRAGLLNEASKEYINLYKNGIKKKKTMYLNTQTALNAYYSFIKCDAVSTLMIMGLRRDAISSTAYKKNANAIFSLIGNLRGDIEEMRNSICKYHA